MLKILIKNFVLGICVLGNLSVSAQERNKYSEYKALQIKLEELCHIEEDVLINYRGQTYPKIIYRDLLHEDLCFVLKDPEQADIIHKAYFHHILPHLPNELRESFSTSLLKVCVLFGSDQFSPESAFIASLKEENTTVCDWVFQH
jgi:hypothetical protein